MQRGRTPTDGQVVAEIAMELEAIIIARAKRRLLELQEERELLSTLRELAGIADAARRNPVAEVAS